MNLWKSMHHNDCLEDYCHCIHCKGIRNTKFRHKHKRNLHQRIRHRIKEDTRKRRNESEEIT